MSPYGRARTPHAGGCRRQAPTAACQPTAPQSAGTNTAHAQASPEACSMPQIEHTHSDRTYNFAPLLD
jgi:hypothetical protein